MSSVLKSRGSGPECRTNDGKGLVRSLKSSLAFGGSGDDHSVLLAKGWNASLHLPVILVWPYRVQPFHHHHEVACCCSWMQKAGSIPPTIKGVKPAV